MDTRRFQIVASCGSDTGSACMFIEDTKHQSLATSARRAEYAIIFIKETTKRMASLEKET
jgi:hypothetical protein